MPSQQPWTAIEPSGTSLPEHLQALDLLSARIRSLTAKTRWSARIPLNSKASMLGQVVHTNELKVDIGGGYWVEMTAQEAEQYVQRRKTDLLLQHAGLRERTPKAPSSDSTMSLAGLPAEVSFNPLFTMPAAAGPSTQASRGSQAKEAEPKITEEQPAATLQSPPASSDAVRATPKSAEPTPTANTTTLQDVVEQFLETQQNLANSSKDQIDKLKGLQSADALVTEEGLPIHEIREDLNGDLIGEAPEPTWSGDAVAREEAEEEDYWSEEAKARREAKRRLIFGDDEGDEDEEDDDSGSAAPAEDDASAAQVQEPENISADARPTSPLPRRSSLTSSNGPKSILKPPGRKKSVTFDESVPVPPDSPPVITSGKVGFPLPTTDINTETSEFEPRPIPIIPVPKPAVKNTVGESFAGFKRGFLSPSSPSKPAPHITPTAPDMPPVKKAPSLFAQRMAAQEHPKIEEILAETVEEEPVKPAVKDAITERTNGLPKMSESKHMSSMKPAVVERASEPLLPPSRNPGPSHIGMASSSRPNGATSRITEIADDEDGDEEEEEEEEDDEEYDDEEEEEDEYDLEQVIHAREIAQEYHRLHASQDRPRRDDDDAMDVSAVMDSLYEEGLEDEDEAADGEAGIGEGGVMMGLPQLSADGKIVNPTPDGIRQFVRIGRLDNGNLVLAPGEEGWSDDENEEKTKHREGLKRQLLGLDPPKPPAVIQPRKPPVMDVGMPPAVVTDRIVETPVKQQSGNEQAEPAEQAAPATPAVEKPKKVSRFKAARMGG